jgi:large subunit ribosomal protein L18
MIDKKQSRLRRSRRTRAKIAELKVVRLTVNRSNSHIYAQVIDASGSKVLASASSAEKAVRGELKNGGNVKAAAVVGKTVAFDRSGYRFHGRVKALAQAAREAGLKF